MYWGVIRAQRAFAVYEANRFEMVDSLIDDGRATITNQEMKNEIY